MSEEPEWAKVLDTVYKENLVWEADADFDEDHPVVSAVDLDSKATQRNLAFLSQAGLIGRLHVGVKADVSYPGREGLMGLSGEAERRGTHTGLTERGFSVAHRREVMQQQEQEEERRIQSQNEVNSAIGYLTLGLLFVTFMDTFLSTMVPLNLPIETVYVALLLDAVIVFVISLLLYRTNLLNPRTVMN